MELSNLRPAAGEVVDMLQETVKQPVRVIKVKRLVQVQQDPDLKVVRCLYTDEYLREDLQTVIQRT